MHVLDGRLIRSCCELAIDVNSGLEFHFAFENWRIEVASEAGHDRLMLSPMKKLRGRGGGTINVSLDVGNLYTEHLGVMAYEAQRFRTTLTSEHHRLSLPSFVRPSTHKAFRMD